MDNWHYWKMIIFLQELTAFMLSEGTNLTGYFFFFTVLRASAIQISSHTMHYLEKPQSTNLWYLDTIAFYLEGTGQEIRGNFFEGVKIICYKSRYRAICP